MVDVVDICVPDWLGVDGLLILCIVYKTSLIVLILLSVFFFRFDVSALVKLFIPKPFFPEVPDGYLFSIVSIKTI